MRSGFGGTSDVPAAGSAYEAELAQRARTAGLIIAWTSLLVAPSWTVFDRILAPEHAGLFLALRLAGDVPVLAALLLLWRHPLGLRRPALLSYLVLAVVQVEIAVMVVRAGEAREAYVLGFSLAVYGSGCLAVGGLRWTALLAATSWAALGLAALTAPDPLPARDVAGACFYLATASLIALLAHGHRDRLSRRELSARTRLEEEQARTRALLDRLERLSHEDALTGLANRRRWDAELDAACTRARALASTVAVVLIDVDRFKQINDRHGHAGGDRALIEVGQLVSARVGAAGLVARLGGDEIGVLLVEVDAERAAFLAEELRKDAVARAAVTLSLGVSWARGADALPTPLMSRADQELYRAKLTRNTVCAGPSTPTAEVPQQRREIEPRSYRLS